LIFSVADKAVLARVGYMSLTNCMYDILIYSYNIFLYYINFFIKYYLLLSLSK
jgi:hypothetical protein